MQEFKSEYVGIMFLKRSNGYNTGEFNRKANKEGFSCEYASYGVNNVLSQPNPIPRLTLGDFAPPNNPRVRYSQVTDSLHRSKREQERGGRQECMF